MADKCGRLPARETAIELRAHHLICLLGFSGLGYSPEFVAQMREKARLVKDGSVKVSLVNKADCLCRACPHLREDGCSPGGHPAEEDVTRMDNTILRLLGMQPHGKPVPSIKLLAQIAKTVSAQSLGTVCAGCRWQPIGLCRQGLADLKMST